MRHTRAGVTAIELLVVVSIIAVVGTAVGASLAKLKNDTQVASEAQNISAVIAEARTNASAGKNNLSWGVHFDTTDYILFRGASYNPLDTSNKTYALAGGISFGTIALNGGGSDVIFARINGGTSQYGTLEVTGQGRISTIAIQASGETAVSGALPAPGGTRVIDTRHAHFTLPWSIHNAITLTVTFHDPPNPDTVQNIAMSSYFNIDNSVFDWSNQYVVGGETQAIRVHTHLINPGGNTTILSVHRDKMENTKAVDISIDATLAASYSASGTVTPGVNITYANQ